MLSIQKFFYKELDSTNLFANQQVEKGAVTAPSWIRADFQNAGKGQGGRQWSSEPGLNLTGSLIIFPLSLPAARQFDLSMLCSLAVSGFLELFVDEIRIKWPNDLYAGDKKIGGILIENAVTGSTIGHAVIGIGLNINQMEFPEDIPNPVSLKMITGINYRLPDLEDTLLEALAGRLRGYLGGDADGPADLPGPGQFRPQYLRKLYRFKEYAPYRASGQWFEARIIGVDETGQLMLESRSGTVRSFGFREVEYVM